MPVTIRDIADDLNLSVVTVSKVLRNKGKFSSRTIQRVLKRAKELDYRTNWVARSLVTGQTFTIGLLLPDFTHSFFAEVAKSIAETMRPHGYHAIISYFDEDPTVERSEAQALIDRRVDGLVIASSQRSRDENLFHRLHRLKLPVVLIDRPIPKAGVSFVGVDNRKIGYLATEHLIEQGCHRIACLRGPKLRIADDRFEGCCQALRESGKELDEAKVAEAGYSDSSGSSGMMELLRSPAMPDGVVCFSDPVAIGAIEAVRGAGLKVPNDIAVVGAGNIHYGDQLAVPLTTVDQRTIETGRIAAELLLAQIQSKGRAEPKRILIEPKLVVRESSRRKR